jgi:hypothetical protein
LRTLFLTLALTLAPSLIKAEVVYTRTENTTRFSSFNGNSSSFSNTIGQSFRNNGSISRLDYVTFGLGRGGDAYTSGTLNVKVYATTGTAGDYTPTGSVLFQSTTIDASTITSTFQDYTFSGFSGSNLLSPNHNYIALLTWQGINFNGTNGLDIKRYEDLAAPYGDFNATFNGEKREYQLYGTISVPEPGTLLLGSIAAACGGGAWWRRKRHQASKATAQESVA